MSNDPTYPLATMKDEHRKENNAKAVDNYVWDVDNLEWVRSAGNSDGTLASGLNIPQYDYVSATYPTATTESYVFKTGGSSGTTVATVNLTYTDNTKDYLSSAEKV